LPRSDGHAHLDILIVRLRSDDLDFNLSILDLKTKSKFALKFGPSNLDPITKVCVTDL